MNTYTNSKGLTLIEVLMTVFIMAIITSIALPRMDFFAVQNLSSFARKFSGEINYYFNQSVLSKTSYKIEIDFTNANSYSVFSYKEGEWREIKSKILLPEGVFFKDIITQADNFTVNNGIGEIRFTYLGYMDSVIIHITDRKDKNFSLITNSISGKVSIFDKYVKKGVY
ncbi:prepilin-type N-terminal cleavage/methylation domain-containing protein [Candidatus Desantisbacteria bacterium]|nr:prepilin-type N-terminal cleavage/methylation domain-containing protein [Candidatus Desantisbacteria bacterium]